MECKWFHHISSTKYIFPFSSKIIVIETYKPQQHINELPMSVGEIRECYSFTFLPCSLVKKGYRKALERKDLWSLNPCDASEDVVPKFERHWNKELNTSLWLVLVMHGHVNKMGEQDVAQR